MFDPDQPPSYLAHGRTAALTLLSMCGLIVYVLPACTEEFEDEFESEGFDSGAVDESSTTRGGLDTADGDTNATDGSAGDADGSAGDTDTTGGVATGQEDATSTPGTETGSADTSDDTTGGDGDQTITCNPSGASFSDTAPPQAGISFDLNRLVCEVVSGLPKSDQLVIDQFAASFGGSGSGGLTVTALTGGTFSNEDGFYVLDNLPTQEPITITFVTARGVTFSTTFTIDAANGEVTDASFTVQD